MIYIDVFNLVSSFKYPWMSSLPFLVVCTYMQKSLGSPLSVIFGLHLYFSLDIISSPLIFIQENHQTVQLATVHPADNVENIQ